MTKNNKIFMTKVLIDDFDLSYEDFEKSMKNNKGYWFYNNETHSISDFIHNLLKNKDIRSTMSSRDYIINCIMVPMAYKIIKTKGMFNIFYNKFVTPMLKYTANRIQNKSKDFSHIDMDILNTTFSSTFERFYNFYYKSYDKILASTFIVKWSHMINHKIFNFDLNVYKTSDISVFTHRCRKIIDYIMIDMFVYMFLDKIQNSHDKFCKIITNDIQMYFINLAKYQINKLNTFNKNVHNLIDKKGDYKESVINIQCFANENTSVLCSYNNIDIFNKTLDILKDSTNATDLENNISNLIKLCFKHIDLHTDMISNCLSMNIKRYFINNIHLLNYKLYDFIIYRRFNHNE